MSEGEKRRAQILEILRESEQPVSGTDLAGRLHVSRQVIVQDVALLRAENKEIMSTYKGYVMPSVEKQRGCVRVFRWTLEERFWMYLWNIHCMVRFVRI